MAHNANPAQNPAHLSASLAGLFPRGVLAAELRGPCDPALLYPQEAAHLGNAVAERCQEFAGGRVCARRVLAELGILDFPIKAAEDRQPQWPQAIVGSITHTTGFCAAVAAEKKLIAAIGIDSERAESVESKLWPGVCTAAEIDWLRGLPESQQAAAATLLFTAKEAFYKCQYPLVGERLSFHDATVEVPAWPAVRGAFTIHANCSIAIARHARLPLAGRYVFHEQFVTAGVAVPG